MTEPQKKEAPREAVESLLRAQAWLKKIQGKATELGGIVTCPFSQAIEPVQSFLKLNEDARRGICHALATYWCAYHGNDGSIWNEVYTELNGRQLLRIDKLKWLVAEFAASLRTKLLFFKFKQGVTAQWEHSDRVLRDFGMILRRSMSDGEKVQIEGTTAPTGNTATTVYNALKANPGAGQYAMIAATDPSRVGHTMCAYYVANTGITEVTFFDPNFGEFFFGGASAGINFHNFLTYLFGQFYAHMKSYDVRIFAKAMGFVAAKKKK